MQSIRLSQRFTDKVVVVTGGGQGIGMHISRSFASQGAKVVIAELNKEAGLANEQYIKSQNQTAHFVETDVSQEESVKKMVSTVSNVYGGINCLVNNAGISSFGDIFEENSVQHFDKVIGVNLRGCYIAAKYCAQNMRDRGIKDGAIVNIASTRALMSEPNTEAYTASKGGIVSLTHALAISLGKFGIRVNCVSPGWIDVTGSQYGSREATPLKPEDHSQHPVGRVGVPDDVANAVLFFCSGESSFATGQNLYIDGGMTKKMIYAE